MRGVNGRFIEGRLALVRDDPSKQPVFYELTLHAGSSSSQGELFLDDTWARDSTAHLIGQRFGG
ncbi:MAG: hypothetical protein N3I86_02090 [Verrucomicrobiae bacterium]|nr:hypothetical protein [Verrucomicrobiae bacterium]